MYVSLCRRGGVETEKRQLIRKWFFVSPNTKKVYKAVITCVKLAEQSVENMSSSSSAWVHCFICKKSVLELKCAIYLTACGNTVCDSCRPK